MKQKRYTPEQIITILREVDSGKGIQDVCRAHNISPQSYHRWRKKYEILPNVVYGRVSGSGGWLRLFALSFPFDGVILLCRQ